MALQEIVLGLMLSTKSPEMQNPHPQIPIPENPPIHKETKAILPTRAYVIRRKDIYTNKENFY